MSRDNDWLPTWREYASKPGPNREKAAAIVAEIEARLAPMPDLPSAVLPSVEPQTGLFDGLPDGNPAPERPKARRKRRAA